MLRHRRSPSDGLFIPPISPWPLRQYSLVQNAHISKHDDKIRHVYFWTGFLKAGVSHRIYASVHHLLCQATAGPSASVSWYGLSTTGIDLPSCCITQWVHNSPCPLKCAHLRKHRHAHMLAASNRGTPKAKTAKKRKENTSSLYGQVGRSLAWLFSRCLFCFS